MAAEVIGIGSMALDVAFADVIRHIVIALIAR
ncbi:hypothetical protein J2W42_006233 [Rhizobium tibeticum]|nr:hypothetical protein [Rhizobium tibeticum]